MRKKFKGIFGKEKIMEYAIKEITKTKELLGKTIEFGYNPKTDSLIEWTIIAQDKEKILIWSKEIISQKTFSDVLHKDDLNLYKNSNVRKYLNEEFIKVFSKSEKEFIVDNSKDLIYILSEDDLKRYLSIDYHKENEVLRAKPNGLLFSEGFETNESGYGKYWLKNFDSRHDYASIVDSFGNITRAKIDNKNVGIRPAMWIKKDRMHKLIEEK